MKKRLIAAAVAATVTLSMGVAMASPIQFDGDITTQYRWSEDSKALNLKSEGNITTFKLNATAALNEKTDFYARLAGQVLTADEVGADFRTDLYGSSILSLDRFGFVLKGDNATYKIGRQGANVGATALLYSTEGKIGNYSGTIDGVTANVKSGVTDINVLAGKVSTHDTDGIDAKLYSLHAGYQPTKNLTVGATFAKADYDVVSTNHWAVDASYQLGKANVFGEYTKSDVDLENAAFAVGTSYAFDNKNSLAVIYSKVEAFGDIAAMTDFDPQGKGIYYSYNHKISNDTNLNIFYKDMEGVYTGDKYNSFRTTVNYKF
ncbi:porin [Dendrosporobacter sp. 1207_IL3150]|uniref:porin n=1 Tax=Dendrosporobacter sp. 1207_IL3150 TaxID=3084054 RepID=UPI002FD9912C